LKDVTPIILDANHPFWMLVPRVLPVNSVSELVALAKTKPTQLAYASAGAGNLTHLAGELFKSSTGADLLHVPYKTGAAAITDTVAGRVALYIGPMLGTQQQVAGKRLKVLAVTSSARSPLAPEVPTVGEAGYPAIDVSGLTAFLVPAGTPDAVVARLNSEANGVLLEPEMRAQFSRLAAEVAGGRPEELRERIRADIAKWSAVVKSAGITLD
jgi:tripartite-type tricarboxylate transporter receptor subunit TctC